MKCTKLRLARIRLATSARAAGDKLINESCAVVEEEEDSLTIQFHFQFPHLQRRLHPPVLLNLPLTLLFR
jgi:hypothetical protein